MRLKALLQQLLGRAQQRLRRRHGPLALPWTGGGCSEVDRNQVESLVALRNQLDPFALAETVDRKLERIFTLANQCRSLKPAAKSRTKQKTARLPQRRIAMPSGFNSRVTF